METLIKRKSIKDFKSFEKNPSTAEGIEIRKKVDSEKHEVWYDKHTGEEKFVIKPQFTYNQPKDTLEYRKVYKNGINTIRDFSVPALKLFCYLLEHLKINSQTIRLNPDIVSEYCGYSTNVMYYKAIVELLEKEILFKNQESSQMFFINVNILFNGDRTKL